MCVYCGSDPDTSDHVPPKVLLDEPFPQSLPVVDACTDCNTGSSLDEQYIACFLECVIRGTVESSGIQRPNIRRILGGNLSLQRRIEASREKDEAGNLLWKPEFERIQKMIVKLARGHAAYELYPQLDEPVQIAFAPLPVLSDQERTAFEVATGKPNLWPELGSRAFFRAVGKKPDELEPIDGWIVVQPGRYRYDAAEWDGVLVRIVLSEYLACLVAWE